MIAIYLLAMAPAVVVIVGAIIHVLCHDKKLRKFCLMYGLFIAMAMSFAWGLHGLSRYSDMPVEVEAR